MKFNIFTPLFILSVAIFMTGCVDRTGYGDGRLVRIDVSSAFTSYEVELIRQATHAWDEFGVNTRLPDEMNGKDTDTTIHLDRLAIDIGGGVEGTTLPGIDRIIVYANSIWSLPDNIEPNKPQYFVVVVAHEIGHNLGLEHVGKESARMYYATSSRNLPLTSGTGSDKEEFCGIYWYVKACQRVEELRK